MRVVELTAYHVRIRLKQTVRHASHSRNETESLVVRCRLDDGSAGWGEGLPRPYVTGETIDTVWDQLHQTDWSRELGGTLDGLPEVVQRAGMFQLGGGHADPRQCFGNAARCGVEVGLLDAATRSAGVPFSRVTDLVPESLPIRNESPRVQYSLVLPAFSPWKRRAVCWMGRLCGFRQMKVKVGMKGIDDAAMLQPVRRILGDSADVRADANEAWSCSTLEKRLESLRPYRLSSIEQPVPHAEVAGLSVLRGKVGVPIMLDESLCSREDARRAIEHGTCDLFNIRLSKCGGFVRSLQIAALAHNAGLGYQLGCQVGETGILSAAGRHFATSVGHIRFLEGSYDRHLVRDRLTQENLTFGRGGYAPALSGPGLGVTIDPQELKRVMVRETRFEVR